MQFVSEMRLTVMNSKILASTYCMVLPIKSK